MACKFLCMFNESVFFYFLFISYYPLCCVLSFQLSRPGLITCEKQKTEKGKFKIQ